MKSGKTKWLLLALAIGVLAIFFWRWSGSEYIATKSAKKAQNTAKTTQPSSLPINKADSLWVVVNKGRYLPASYAPSAMRPPQIPLRLSATSSEMLLRSEAAAALEEMAKAAKAQGINLMLASGYRSYKLQIIVHDAEVRANGATAADAVSARPGYSEHQTGLAADIEPASRNCELDTCFGNTAEGKWLEANAYKYGFIIRYPKDLTQETGYNYEPWHVRYVGNQLAADIHKRNISLEKYFNLTFNQNYTAQSFPISE